MTCGRANTTRLLAEGVDIKTPQALLGEFRVFMRSRWAAYAVAEVRDVSILESSDEFEFDVTTTAGVEQSSAVPEEDMDQVDLHLVHFPGSEERLRRARPMDHDRPAPSGRASLTGAVLDSGDEPRVAGRHVLVTHVVGEDEDRHTVVVVALPTPGKFEGPTAGDHRAGRHQLAVNLSARAVGFPIVEPVEETSTAMSELLAGSIVRAGDVPVE
jgi:hypothetical protein